VSDASGRDEIYVTDFANACCKWQVSNNGGTEPRWGREGTEIFYLSPDMQIMAVGVNKGATGLSFGAPNSLFSARPKIYLEGTGYDVAPDGERFLINTYCAENPLPLTLIANWTANIQPAAKTL
jgi:eukaryotic-like serine/threonine-protein kinase